MGMSSLNTEMIKKKPMGPFTLARSTGGGCRVESSQENPPSSASCQTHKEYLPLPRSAAKQSKCLVLFLLSSNDFSWHIWSSECPLACTRLPTDGDSFLSMQQQQQQQQQQGPGKLLSLGKSQQPPPRSSCLACFLFPNQSSRPELTTAFTANAKTYKVLSQLIPLPFSISLQLPWPPQYSLNTSSTMSSQGFCSGQSLEQSPPDTHLLKPSSPHFMLKSYFHYEICPNSKFKKANFSFWPPYSTFFLHNKYLPLTYDMIYFFIRFIAY